MPRYGQPVPHECIICSKLVTGSFSPTCGATSCKRMYKGIKLERQVTTLLVLGICVKCGRDLLANGEPAGRAFCRACGDKKRQENKKHREYQQKRRKEGERLRKDIERRHKAEQAQKDRRLAGLPPSRGPAPRLPKGTEIAEDV